MATRPSVPNAANLQAAVNGMAGEGNIIAQSIQTHNAHQPGLNTELPLRANYNVAQIHQQLAAMQANIAAMQVSIDTIDAQ
jgi:hypothetical protein